MARIRSIKPEFPHSESMGRISRDARLLFIESWTLADDSGKIRGNSRMLASLLFPYDDDAPALIDKWIEELVREECWICYMVDGNHYVQITNWEKHQKIDRPSGSKFPAFDESSRILANPREHSSGDQRIKGSKDRKGEDGISIGEADAPPSPLADPPSPQKAKKQDPLDLHVAGCVTRLNEVAGRRYEPTSAACKHLRARLRSVPVAERESVARQACLIAEFKASQWLGDPKMRNYLRPETLWGAEHWDTYGQEAADWDEAGRPPPLAKNGKPIEPTRRQMIEEALKDL